MIRQQERIALGDMRLERGRKVISSGHSKVTERDRTKDDFPFRQQTSGDGNMGECESSRGERVSVHDSRNVRSSRIGVEMQTKLGRGRRSVPQGCATAVDYHEVGRA